MSVIVNDARNPNYDGNLLTANSWYRAEAYNVWANGGVLSTTRTLPVTFANAGNLLGIVLVPSFNQTLAVGNTKTIKVTLQKLITGTWTDQASTQTLTVDAMNNGMYPYGAVGVPFKFATPTAVDTTAGLWRFNITEPLGATIASLRTSDGVNLTFMAWCDTQVSATSGSDFLTVVDKMVINGDFITKGYTGTGYTLLGACGFVCKTTDATMADTYMVKWASSPAASYMFTMDGAFQFGGLSGIQVGTLASPIPYANIANLKFLTAPTAGTATGSACQTGFVCIDGAGRVDFNLHGEAQTNMTTLTSDAAAGQKVVNVVDSTAFQVGDLCYVGREDTTGNGTWNNILTIASKTSTTITFTTNILGQTRKIGGVVSRMAGCGVRYYGTDLTTWVGYNPSPVLSFNVLSMSGVLWQNCSHTFGMYVDLYKIVNPSLARPTPRVSNCIFETRATQQRIWNGGSIPPEGLIVENTIVTPGTLVNAMLASTWNINGTLFASGALTTNNCYLSRFPYPYNYNATGALTSIFTNNIVEHFVTGGYGGGVDVLGAGGIYSNNKFWGYGGGSYYGALTIKNSVNMVINNNTFDNCSLGICFLSSAFSVNIVGDGNSFGQSKANTFDIGTGLNHFTSTLFKNCIGNVTFDTSNAVTLLPKNFINGTKLSFTNINTVTNADKIEESYGEIVRTGYGLSDTTVWTGSAFATASAGQFGMRLAPNNGTNLLTYQDNNGSTTIGNCQNLPMQVSVRVKIANAAYYAGVHTKPTLKVTYDNGTVVTAVATGTTADQQLIVNFTPTTTVSAITVEVNGATDATGSNNQFYLGELVVSIPSGVLVDTTRLGSWANALPLGSSRTFPANSSIWDEVTANHTGAGTYGKEVNDIKNDTGLIGALL